MTAFMTVRQDLANPRETAMRQGMAASLSALSLCGTVRTTATTGSTIIRETKTETLLGQTTTFDCEALFS